MRRFATELRGEALSSNEVPIEVRVLKEEGKAPRFFRLIGLAAGPLGAGSSDEARAAVEEELAAAGFRVSWKDSCAPQGDEEAPCFVCGAAVARSERYPEHLCGACVLEAVDARGRELVFRNPREMGTGFERVVVDTGDAGDDHVCFVRGTKCWADEAYFGGIVVVPYPRG